MWLARLRNSVNQTWIVNAQTGHAAAEPENRSSAAASGLDGSNRDGYREHTTRLRRQSSCRRIRNSIENSMFNRLQQICKKTIDFLLILSTGRSALIEFLDTWRLVPEYTFTQKVRRTWIVRATTIPRITKVQYDQSLAVVKQIQPWPPTTQRIEKFVKPTEPPI